MPGKIVALSFPENSTHLGLEPSVLNVMPPGENVEFSKKIKKFDDAEIDKYLCSVYISGMEEFKQWAMQHDTRKIIAGGYHPTMFPEAFLNFADKVVMGPCDDLATTLSQSNISFERSHYDSEKIGNARFIGGRILRNLAPVEGWIRVHGEPRKQTDLPESPSGRAEVLKDRVIPGVLTFRNTPRFDLYDITNNQQVIPDKKLNDLSTSVNSSFGCPYRCDFCCTPVMFGPNIISKPIEAFGREIDLITKRLNDADPSGSRGRFMFFRDENFPLLKDYQERLKIAQKTNARLYLFASADRVTEEVADSFAANNVYMVCLGLEDPTKNYAKNKKLDEAVGRLKKRGIYTYLSFIANPLAIAGKGDAGSTGAEKGKHFYEVLNQRFRELKPEMICGNFLMPFPGTPLWDEFYAMVSEKDFRFYDSKTPFLVKNELVAQKMKYFMFKAQWDYFTSDFYRDNVRKFETGDTLHLRFLELKEQFDDMLGLMKLRP